MRPPWHFEPGSAERQLCEQFGTRDLAGFGLAGQSLAIGAAGCLLNYVRETQKSALPHLRGIRTELREDSLLLDAATRRAHRASFSWASIKPLCIVEVQRAGSPLAQNSLLGS